MGGDITYGGNRIAFVARSHSKLNKVFLKSISIIVESYFF
jgi:hypothetical protein